MKHFLLGMTLASGMAFAFSPMQGLDDLNLNVEGLLQNEGADVTELDAGTLAMHPGHGGDRHGHPGRHHGRHFRGARKQRCGKIAWAHTQPTQAQNDAAKATLTAAFRSVSAALPAVKAAFGEVKKALEKHPISKAEVNVAVEGVKRVGEPLRQTMQDARIDVINLLNAQQRQTFNQVMARCMGGHR